ncbi:MAG: hypothetical protein IMZ50_09980 [Candidatus Atribacteria bacterium]|nr:hypothetical protein [Candidatus Atribacteria bacterium]
MPELGYDSDWYDHGPGSEEQKRRIALDRAAYLQKWQNEIILEVGRKDCPECKRLRARNVELERRLAMATAFSTPSGNRVLLYYRGDGITQWRIVGEEADERLFTSPDAALAAAEKGAPHASA